MNISSLKKKKKLMVLKHSMFSAFYLIAYLRSNINTAVTVFVPIMEIKRNVNFVCDC